MRRAVVALAIVAASVAIPASAQQTPAGRLIEAARAQLDVPAPDVAATILEQALDARLGASVTEQARGWLLYGISQLMLERVPAARAAFRRALEREPTLRVDSLDYLSEALLREFAAERTIFVQQLPAAAGGPVFAIQVTVPLDTTVPADGGHVRFVVEPSQPARVVSTIAVFETPERVLWADSSQATGADARAWNLRGEGGAIVPPGRYVLRVVGFDARGDVARATERVLAVSRAPVDTQPHPPALTASAFAPETLQLRRGAPSGLLWGAGISALVALGGSALGNSAINSGLPADGTAFVVAGGVAIATVVGFLKGTRARPTPENMERNQRLREQDRQERDRITRANAQALAGAAVRVVLERTGP